MTIYSNRFAAAEKNPDGTYAIFNEITGEMITESVSYNDARKMLSALDRTTNR